MGYYDINEDMVAQKENDPLSSKAPSSSEALSFSEAPSTKSPLSTTAVDADGDPCTANDGSWKCGIFESYESFASYYEINEQIEAQKENDPLSSEAPSTKSPLSTTTVDAD